MTPEPAQPAESPEARAKHVLNRIVVAHNRLRRSETTPQEFDGYALNLLATLAASTARPTERGAVEALQLARPIVEADLEAAKEQGDADWEGMSFTALEAIDAALALVATDQAAEVEGLRSELQSVVEAATGPNGWDWMFPLRVNPVDGKPTIVSHKGGNLFRGYIGTWKEADLMVALANAAPRILAALATQPATGRTMGVSGDVDAALRDALSASTTEVAALQNGGE